MIINLYGKAGFDVRQRDERDRNVERNGKNGTSSSASCGCMNSQCNIF